MKMVTRNSRNNLAYFPICIMVTGSFPGGKLRPGRAADHSPPSSVALMEE